MEENNSKIVWSSFGKLRKHHTDIYKYYSIELFNKDLLKYLDVHVCEELEEGKCYLYIYSDKFFFSTEEEAKKDWIKLINNKIKTTNNALKDHAKTIDSYTKSYKEFQNGLIALLDEKNRFLLKKSK